MAEDASHNKKQPLEIFRELFRNTIRISGMLWRESKGIVIILIVISVLVSFVPFLTSGALALMINALIYAVSAHAFTANLIWLSAFFIAASVLPQFLYIAQTYFAKVFWFFLREQIELLMIERKGAIDLAVHEDPEQNNLFAKVNENGVWRVQNFAEREFYFVQNVLQVIIASIVIAFSQWWLLLLLLVGTIPELIEEMRYGDSVWDIDGARAETRRRFWDLRNHFDDVSKLAELKLFQNVGHFTGRMRQLMKEFMSEEIKNEKKKARRGISVIVTSQLVMTIATIWYINRTVRGFILVGTLTFLLSSIANLRGGLSGLFKNLGGQYQDSLFVSDIFRIVDIKPVIVRKEHEISLDTKKTPEIVFDKVNFAYPGTTKTILKNFSLTIKPGEKIAFVGANGAGKTTFIKLLCRFYDPTSGSITIDGKDLRDVNLDNWYTEIGALFQEYAHYNFTTEEAIGIGNTREPLSLPRAKEAAKTSEADVFIKEWENKYKQMLGKRFSEGIEPSIGQWQKLALARTFYREPRVLILDEPTSSIDAEAEAKIFEKLELLPKDITVILISHRFSTVRQANRIIVLKDGMIEEQGTHHELMKLKGDYARLFTMQAKQYK